MQGGVKHQPAGSEREGLHLRLGCRRQVFKQPRLEPESEACQLSPCLEPSSLQGSLSLEVVISQWQASVAGHDAAAQASGIARVEQFRAVDVDVTWDPQCLELSLW